MYLRTLQINSITVCSLTLRKLATKPTRVFLKTNGAKTEGTRRAAKERELNEKFLRNLSTHQLSDDQVNVLSRGLKYIPTPVTNKTTMRRQLLRDFEQFARRMHLQYIFHGKDKEPHPFHVKSNRMPPVQQSIALESYLESVKAQLADIRVKKPKNNLSRNEMLPLKELKNNSTIKLKKADIASTTVIMNKSNKIQEAEVQLENREHYKPLEAPMGNIAQTKVNQIIDKLHRGKHIDDIVSFAAVFRDVTQHSPERNGCSHSNHIPFPI